MANPTPPTARPRDLNKSSEELALELIYASTKFKPLLSKVKFGNPVVLDQRRDLNNDENTYCPVELDLEYYGEFSHEGGFRYKRLSLSILKADPAVGGIFPPQMPFKTHEVLAQINAQFGVQLSRKDILNETHSSIDTFRLRAHPHSLVWLDEATVTLGNGVLTPGTYRTLESGVIRHLENGRIRMLDRLG